MSPRKHVVITGTGRTGTTFLVELLTHLGLDTGYRVEDLSSRKSAIARAGLERDIRRDDCPYVVKSPYFCEYAEEVLARDDIQIEHVLVPVRDLFAAAESRRLVQQSTLSGLPVLKRLKYRMFPKTLAGGLWRGESGQPDQQEMLLLEKVYRLLLDVSGHLVPTTLLQYPLLVEDCHYLFGKLSPILGGMAYGRFRSAFDAVVRPELVHHFDKVGAA